MRKVWGVVLVMCAAAAAGCSSEAPTPALSASAGPASAPASTITLPPATPASADPCADYLSKFTTRQKLAQLLTVGVTGPSDAANIVESEQVGGIFIGSGTDETLLTAQQMDAVKAKAHVPLMVTIDEEGGRVSRFPNLLDPGPSAREIASSMTPEQAQANAAERAQVLKDIGITVNFAPVVDVTDQDAGMAIGDRSYSADPAKVVQYAGAYIRGMQSSGIGAVIKHFPGHGHASGDSHTGAVTTPGLPELIADDLLPYRDLGNSGAAVMVGHLEVPGLTEPNTPASISPAVMNLLRTGIGYGAAPFNGVIFTDDLSGMAAITSRYDIATAVEKALEAGADVALWISTDAVPDVLDQLEEAVSSGRYPLQRVDQSVLRIARYKNIQLGC